MAEISQRTIAHMIQLFEYLGCFDPTYASMLNEHQPRVTATDLRNALYASGFDNAALKLFQVRRWDFQSILPELRDGSFAGNFDSQPEHPYDYYLVGFANAIATCFQDFGLSSMPEFIAFKEDLRKDGFISDGRRLVEADCSIADVPAELSLLEKTIARSRHDDKATLLHPFN